MISDTLAIGIHHLIADADSPFCRAVVAELRRLYDAAGEMPPLALYHTPNSNAAVVGNPPYVQTHSYTVLRETCPTLDADDGPDTEEDA
jgi:hypothetical protein